MSRRYYYLTPEDREVAKSNGISEETLKYRVGRAGWDIDRAITQPTRKIIRTRIEHLKLARANGVSADAFAKRLKLGWALEEAANTPVLSQKERTKRASLVNQKYDPKDIAEAEANGISAERFRERMRSGWSAERARTTPTMTQKQSLQEALKSSPWRDIAEMQFNLNTQHLERR
ncbi:hypothetical protein [Sporosarcina sp. P17b]|uniref:hypothetical protein n=1 Tax=Sporosarcina sp. P17b TaxID=2048260 RepID=UPI000C16B7A2|nr:hypothetical protein [Sporosarcina sp. P17b]PIC72398.1 hypothetical protein CSV76_15235 [Sporosarcina sp. P17b]